MLQYVKNNLNIWKSDVIFMNKELLLLKIIVNWEGNNYKDGKDDQVPGPAPANVAATGTNEDKIQDDENGTVNCWK